jgi:hypothetical protein
VFIYEKFKKYKELIVDVHVSWQIINFYVCTYVILWWIVID